MQCVFSNLVDVRRFGTATPAGTAWKAAAALLPQRACCTARGRRCRTARCCTWRPRILEEGRGELDAARAVYEEQVEALQPTLDTSGKLSVRTENVMTVGPMPLL